MPMLISKGLGSFKTCNPVQADMSLVEAVKGGHTSLALQLLQCGANVSAVDVSGPHSLHS